MLPTPSESLVRKSPEESMNMLVSSSARRRCLSFSSSSSFCFLAFSSACFWKSFDVDMICMYEPKRKTRLSALVHNIMLAVICFSQIHIFACHSCYLFFQFQTLRFCCNLFLLLLLSAFSLKALLLLASCLFPGFAFLLQTKILFQLFPNLDGFLWGRWKLHDDDTMARYKL